MLISEEEKNAFPYLQKISDVMKSLDIPITELFWDENEFGFKPDKYAVYYITSEQDALSSDDESENDCVEITVSFYIRGKMRALKLAALKEFLAAGFFVSTGYETYEKDTHYKHFDIELKFYF